MCSRERHGVEVRAALDRILARRPGIGNAPLVPSLDDPAVPIRYELASEWLRKVAAAGGWAPESPALKRCYQLADEATMLQGVPQRGPTDSEELQAIDV